MSNVIVIAIVVAIIAVGIGTGLFAGYFMVSNAENPNQVASTHGTGASMYYLDMVVVAGAEWNSTTSAPRFYVMTPQGLASSANISFPSHTLIQLLVVNYDTPAPLPSQYSVVSGTVGNVVYLLNGTAAAGNFSASDSNAVSSMDPNSQVSHTFTIPKLGINIPIAANSTEIADFYINQTGTFAWQCEDPCGFGPTGWLGPMAAAGWMLGSVTVS